MERRIALSYSTGAVGTGVFATVPGLLLLYYLTDVIGVAAATASLVLFLPKIWDAVLNPIVGSLSDRSGTRRPYLMAGAIVTPVMFALLFSAPSLGSPWRTAVYVGVVYTLAMTGYALFQVPWVAMPTEMIPDYHARTRLMSTRMVLLTVGILAGGGLAPLLSGGKSGGRGGYTLMSVVLAVVLAAAMLNAWRGTRGARQAPPAAQRLGARAQLALVRGNRGFLACSALMSPRPSPPAPCSPAHPVRRDLRAGRRRAGLGAVRVPGRTGRLGDALVAQAVRAHREAGRVLGGKCGVRCDGAVAAGRDLSLR